MQFCIIGAARAYYVDAGISMDSLNLNQDLIVAETGVVNANGITVSDGIRIVNSGVINSDFYADDDVILYVQNSGVINGAFHLYDNASVIQIVHSANDIVPLNVSGNFEMWVNGAQNILLTDIVDIAANADNLILDNSQLIFNNVGVSGFNGDITIVGDVMIILPDIRSVDLTRPVLTNINGGGRVYFDVMGLSPLYDVMSSIYDGNLYLKFVRETDYVKVLNNAHGRFLNDLRRISPDDKLLAALDMAPDMPHLTDIMSRSVRLNPIRLMDMVRLANVMDILTVSYAKSDAVGGVAGVDMLMTHSGDMYRGMLGGVLGLNKQINVGGAFYIGALNFSDDINEYAARVYGGNAYAQYRNSTVRANAMAGLAVGQFDIGPVFDGDAVKINPVGISVYGAADVGVYAWRKFDVDVAPFVGAMIDVSRVASDDDLRLRGNVGLDMNYHMGEFDIAYDYGTRFGVMTNGAPYAMLVIKFNAAEDDIGGEINTAVIDDDMGFVYRISIMARVGF